MSGNGNHLWLCTTIYIRIYVKILVLHLRDGNGSVVECLSQDRGVASSSLTLLCLWARHINPCLVLSSTQEDPSWHNWKTVDLDTTNQIKQALHLYGGKGMLCESLITYLFYFKCWWLGLFLPIWAATQENLHSGVCEEQRCRSACASA